MTWTDWVGPILASTVVSTLISSLITWRVATRAQVQKELIETITVFQSLIALAHARDASGNRTDVGKSEMVAGIEMVAAIGLNYGRLRESAVAFLRMHQESYDPASTTSTSRSRDIDVSEAARMALTRLLESAPNRNPSRMWFKL